MTAEPSVHPAAALGPYFALALGSAPPPGYRPLDELFTAGVAARLPEVAARLHTAEPRVAASVMQLGLAARFWSVTLGALAVTGAIPALEQAHWRQLPDGPLDLWLPADHPTTTDPHAVLTTVLTPLNAAVRAAAPVSERLLWGNAASALVGTLRMIQRQLPTAQAAEQATRALLARAPLAGTLAAHGPRLRRTSCCLYYRLPGGGLCGDCVFDTAPRLSR
ncbi:ferric iron reductase [Streptomyces tateyamensis]|uniref:Ferric iron reductase n=1 Tax=Streptomyces tateyamensis TaxID=565073 RepID=A0A2V4NKR6_9ACTN|nr:(2Fe-2S)-binding protein [Streptomyces tateyamensis]PYC75816.1 ferric iron reductase [Streptomyces tateyamensis]